MCDDFGESGGDGEAGLGTGGLLLAIGSCWRGGAKRDIEVAFHQLKVW